MQKRFVIQDAISKEYWYGWYTNKNWTDDIAEAKLYPDRFNMKDWIRLNADKMKGKLLVVIEVWSDREFY